MEDLFTFAKEYYTDGGINFDKFIPRLQVKLREELCLKGRKIAYQDFTKVIKRENSYTPLVCWSGELKSDDVVMDFAPLFSVGVAEIVTMLSHESDLCDMRFLGWCQELPFAEDWYSMLEKTSTMLDTTKDIDPLLLVAETLRSGLIDYRFVTVRRIYATMQALHLINPQSYCVALIEVMKLAFSVISIFMCPPEDFHGNSGRVGDIAVYEDIVQSRLSRCGAIEYSVDGSDKLRKISDGRGLGIGAFTMFLMDVFNRFGEFRGTSNAVPIREPRYRRYIHNMFESCIGDDLIGRFVRTGRCRVLECKESVIMLGNEANLLAVDCHDGMMWNGRRAGRGIYEAHLLWKHAVGVDEVRNVGVLPPFDCTYGTRVDFIHACLDFAYSERGMKLSRDLMKKSEDKLVDAVLQSMDADAVLEKYKQDIVDSANEHLKSMKKVVDEKVAEAEAAIKAKEEAEHSATEKQHIIDELRSEVQGLRTKVRSIYSEDVDAEDSPEDGVVSEGVSMEEMLELVNSFRLIVVGGYDTMQQRLEQAGFTNFYCISSERASNNTLVSGDFFCLCTKFLSHKLAYNVETHYSSQADHFFYFNGTNVDVFLRTCYDFITDWFESGGGDPHEA